MLRCSYEMGLLTTIHFDRKDAMESNIHRVLIDTSYNIFGLLHSPFLKKDSGL